MLLNIEKSGEKDKERSKERLVNTDPGPPVTSAQPGSKLFARSIFQRSAVDLCQRTCSHAF